MKKLFDGQHINDERLRAIIERSDIVDINRINISDFEVFLDELTADVNDGDEEEQMLKLCHRLYFIKYYFISFQNCTKILFVYFLCDKYGQKYNVNKLTSILVAMKT